MLVGHSYGGLVIGGVAEKVPERIGRLVYLDAYIPKDNKSAFDNTWSRKLIQGKSLKGARNGVAGCIVYTRRNFKLRGLVLNL